MTVKIRVELLKNNELVLARIWKENEYHSYMNKKISDMIQSEFNISNEVMQYFKLQNVTYTEPTPSELIRVINGIHSVLSKCIYEVRVFVNELEIPLE